jgi:hypothetical protein
MNEKSRSERLMEIELETNELECKRELIWDKIRSLDKEKQKILKDEAAHKCGAPEWLLK